MSSIWTKLRDAGENLVTGAANAVLPGAGAVLGPLQSTSSHGGSGVSGSPAASAADPFAEQRDQYQKQLQTLMSTDGAKGDENARTLANGIAAGKNSFAPAIGDSFNGVSRAASDLSAMTQPGYKFDTSDPSYAFRLQQGTENLNRGAAKSGLLGSGNRLAALQDYGQQTASTEFQSEFARKQGALNGNLSVFNSAVSGMNTVSAMEGQKFNELDKVDQNTQNMFQNNYARLSQLAGANIGNPGQAGQLLQGQINGAAAQTQQWGGQIATAAGKLWDSATSGSGWFGGGGSSTPADGGNPMVGSFSDSGTSAAMETGW